MRCGKVTKYFQPRDQLVAACSSTSLVTSVRDVSTSTLTDFNIRNVSVKDAAVLTDKMVIEDDDSDMKLTSAPPADDRILSDTLQPKDERANEMKIYALCCVLVLMYKLYQADL